MVSPGGICDARRELLAGVAHLYKNRIMVGRRAAVVLAEAYLSGSVLALERLSLGACFRSPVGVCKHAIAVHVERRRHKHVVDAAVRLQVGVE